MLVVAAALVVSSIPDPEIEVFGQACLGAVPMTREALASVAEARGWQAVEVAPSERLEWRAVYRAGDVVVRLDQHRATEVTLAERICVVDMEAPEADWRNEVSALTANGQLVGPPANVDRSPYRMPPGFDLTVWDLPDGSRIHGTREADGTVELSVNYATALGTRRP